MKRIDKVRDAIYDALTGNEVNLVILLHCLQYDHGFSLDRLNCIAERRFGIRIHQFDDLPLAIH